MRWSHFGSPGFYSPFRLRLRPERPASAAARIVLVLFLLRRLLALLRSRTCNLMLLRLRPLLLRRRRVRDLRLRLATLHWCVLHLLLRTRHRLAALLRRVVRDLRLRPLLLTTLHRRLALLLLLRRSRLFPLLRYRAVLLLRTLLLRACL